VPKPPEERAENWDHRHQVFNDNDLLYDVYSVMRQKPISHTEVPFLGTDTGRRVGRDAGLATPIRSLSVSTPQIPF
jgi:hypothetical protein